MNIRIAALPEAFLRRVREEGTDDQGQPVRRIRSVDGGEPCRDVLRRARPGEELILASFSPFSKPGPYKEFGPVFVLAKPSSEPVGREVFPTNDYFRDRLVLRAYNADESILDAALVTPGDVPEVLERSFSQTDVAFMHARFPTYGCFALRVDRI
jgi:hypothetical protein